MFARSLSEYWTETRSLSLNQFHEISFSNTQDSQAPRLSNLRETPEFHPRVWPDLFGAPMAANHLEMQASSGELSIDAQDISSEIHMRLSGVFFNGEYFEAFLELDGGFRRVRLGENISDTLIISAIGWSYAVISDGIVEILLPMRSSLRQSDESIRPALRNTQHGSEVVSEFLVFSEFGYSHRLSSDGEAFGMNFEVE